MQSFRKKAVAATGLALLLTATILPAKVFIRWQGTSDIPGTLTRLGGKASYQADVSINGGRGQIAVIGFRDKFDTTSSDIQRILKLPPQQQPRSATTTVWLLKGKATITRLILLRIPAQQRLLAIAITQSITEYEKSQQQPPLYRGIPAYPGSTPKFLAQNHETKLTIATSAANAPPEAIRQFYFQTLKTAGWHPYLSNQAGPVPQMTIYQRKSEICCIYAASARNGQASNITILHKKLSASPTS
jgi:hypothetical protein